MQRRPFLDALRRALLAADPFAPFSDCRVPCRRESARRYEANRAQRAILLPSLNRWLQISCAAFILMTLPEALAFGQPVQALAQAACGILFAVGVSVSAVLLAGFGALTFIKE